MRGGRAIIVLVLAIAALANGSPTASAYHQPGPIEAKVFKATIDVPSASFSAAGTSGGGEWSMIAASFWKVVYPELAVALEGEVPFRPTPDYAFSAAEAGTVTWAGTTDYNFQSPGPEPFSCTAPLQGPLLVQHATQYVDLVQGEGANVKLELTAWNQFAPNGNGACNPVQSTGFAPWGVDLKNNTQVFATIAREELFEEDEVTKTIQNGPNNSQPACTFGCSGASMSWNGTLELEKNCRNYAGTAKTFTSGGQTVTTAFCESDCNVADCSQADLDLIPVARAAKEEGGEVEFTVGCYGEETCTGAHVLTAANSRRAGKLGSGDFAVEPAAHSDTLVKLSRAGKRVLKREGKIKGTLTATLEGEEVAEPATDSIKVTIK